MGLHLTILEPSKITLLPCVRGEGGIQGFEHLFQALFFPHTTTFVTFCVKLTAKSVHCYV